MNNRKSPWLFCAAMLMFLQISRGQEPGACKVLVKEISGSYTGACKDGLAHGKGTSAGKDKYTGEFKNGLPDGKGKYVYKDGSTYTGNWVKGLKEGKGKFTYIAGGQAGTLTGYWKNGEYAGATDPDELYRITNQAGIGNCTIKKAEGDDTQVTITLIAAMQKYFPADLRINISSGILNQKLKDITITQFTCPLTVEMHFTTRSTGGTKECFLFFDILKPGNFEVTINND